jgi:hypothetical protein
MTYRFEAGHPLGTVWLHDQTAFLNIPKNASTAIKTVVGHLGFREHIGPYQESWEVFTVLRDPFPRFCSGIIEYAHMTRQDPITVAEQVRQHLSDGTFVPLDEHTTPQHVFITMPIDRIFTVERMGDLAEFLGVDDIPPMRITDPQLKTQVETMLEPVYRPDPLDLLIWRNATIRPGR